MEIRLINKFYMLYFKIVSLFLYALFSMDLPTLEYKIHVLNWKWFADCVHSFDDLSICGEPFAFQLFVCREKLEVISSKIGAVMRLGYHKNIVWV